MEATNIMCQKAIDYKKSVANKFMMVEHSMISSRVAGQDFCVTLKVDGHLQILFYENGTSCMINSAGKQKAESLKCIDEFSKALAAAGFKSAVIAAELYVPNHEVRPRCGDVIKALADSSLRDNLALAVFDIVELDGESFSVQHYKEVYSKINSIFGSDNPLCHTIEMRAAESPDQVKEIYDEWVVEGGAEGLVVHNENKTVCKIKPRHSIDAAVIGYTTTGDKIRNLMLAVMREDGVYQMFTVGSTGITEDQRVELVQRLSQKHVDSQFIFADKRGIAFQMVVPEIVLEVSVIELVTRGNDGKIRTNPLLVLDPEKGWLLEGMTPGVSAHGVTIIQERTDKMPVPEHVRLAQLTDLVSFEEPENNCSKLENSTLLARRVFKKVSGAKVMIHKFLIWKTNKEESGRYPAYIFYHTDFSSGRKEIIKRDMAFSSDEQQIREIMEAEIANNIKKGWEEVL